MELIDKAMESINQHDACDDCGKRTDGLMTCTYVHDGSTTNHPVIPEDVLEKIKEAYVTDNYRTCASFGYSLAIKELEEKDKRIKELVELFEKTYKRDAQTIFQKYGYSEFNAKCKADEAWETFKKENNL